MLRDSRARVLVVTQALLPKFAPGAGAASCPAGASMVAGEKAPQGPEGTRGSKTLLARAARRGPATARRPRATTWRSGSTRRARPASRRRRCTCTRTCVRTAELYAGGGARAARGRRRAVGGQAVLRLRPRQRADVPAGGRRHRRAAAGAADAGSRSRAILRQHACTVFCGVPTLSLRRCWPSAADADARLP